MLSKIPVKEFDSKVVGYKPAPPNLLKMNFFTHIFQGFYLDFNLLFIVFFLRNHFGRLFHVSLGAVCFSDGGRGVGCPIGGQHWFWGGVQKKL